MIKTIFSDFFGVLCRNISMPWAKEHVSNPIIIEEMEKLNVQKDLGYLTQDDFINFLSKHTGLKHKEIKDAFYSYAILNYKLIDFYQDLRQKGLNVYLLSNADSLFLNSIIEKEPKLVSIFNKRFISSDIHLIKPNKEYYQYVIDDLKLNPKECVMIDDVQKNLDGASLLGIKTLQYIDFDDFKEI